MQCILYTIFLGDSTLFVTDCNLLITSLSLIIILYVNLFSQNGIVMRISSNVAVDKTSQIIVHDIPIKIDAILFSRTTVYLFLSLFHILITELELLEILMFLLLLPVVNETVLLLLQFVVLICV